MLKVVSFPGLIIVSYILKVFMFYFLHMLKIAYVLLFIYAKGRIPFHIFSYEYHNCSIPSYWLSLLSLWVCSTTMSYIKFAWISSSSLSLFFTLICCLVLYPFHTIFNYYSIVIISLEFGVGHVTLPHCSGMSWVFLNFCLSI